MELKEAMIQALEFEKKGHDLYKEAAEKSSNLIVNGLSKSNVAFAIFIFFLFYNLEY